MIELKLEALGGWGRDFFPTIRPSIHHLGSHAILITYLCKNEGKYLGNKFHSFPTETLRITQRPKSPWETRS